MNPYRYVIALALLPLQLCLAHTETVSLAAVADTSLFELTPNNNLGATTTLVSGTNGQLAKSRALIRFDLGNLPTNAIVTEVTLSLTLAALPGGNTSDPTTFSLHRVFQPWGEGNKSGNNGAQGSDGESTWNARVLPDKLWSQPGAVAPTDYTNQPTASTVVTGLGSYNFESTNLIVDVQDWLAHPQQNFGWMIVNGDEGTSRSARRFGSRESNTPPSLVIQYVEASDEFKIEEVQLTQEFLLLHLNMPAGHGYSVQFRDDLSAAPWEVLTNFPLEKFFQHFVLADPRGTNPQRFYRVEVSPPTSSDRQR